MITENMRTIAAVALGLAAGAAVAATLLAALYLGSYTVGLGYTRGVERAYTAVCDGSVCTFEGPIIE